MPPATGRKNLIRSLEASLSRLGTDYIDLYFLHTWDRVTPVEEVCAHDGRPGAQGKIRHYALSDVPAWFTRRGATTLAECRGTEAPCALQMEYSIVSAASSTSSPDMDRIWAGPPGLEARLASACCRASTAPTQWQRSRTRGAEDHAKVANPSLQKLTPRNWEIVAELEAVAKELGRPMAQVAVNWVANRPASAPFCWAPRGWTNLAQTLSALELELPAELEQRLDRAGRPDPIFPYAFIDTMAPRMHGGALWRRSAPPMPNGWHPGRGGCVR